MLFDKCGILYYDVVVVDDEYITTNKRKNSLDLESSIGKKNYRCDSPPPPIHQHRVSFEEEIKIHTVSNLRLDLMTEEKKLIWCDTDEIIVMIQEQIPKMLKEEKEENDNSMKGQWEEFVGKVLEALTFFFSIKIQCYRNV
jgi:uncharacterized protein YbaR (Trm112 family)